jgi:hypothetical protein
MSGAIFVLCPACRRHVKSGEAVCPFCTARVDESPLADRSVTSARRPLAALMMAGVAGATVSAAHCGGTPASEPPYGLPPIEFPDGSPDASKTPPGHLDASSEASKAPSDSGSEDQ